MPHEGYDDPVMNDGLGFLSNAPVSELTKCVTRAIEASDVSLAPPIVETTDGVTHGTRPTTAKPNEAWGSGRPMPTQKNNRPRKSRVRQTWANTPNGGNTGVYGPKKEYQDIQPPTDSPVGCRLGGYTHKMRSRAAVGKSKKTSDDSYRVHKPGVPNGPASQQKFGPIDDVANDAQLLGRPKCLKIGRKSDPVSDRKA